MERGARPAEAVEALEDAAAVGNTAAHATLAWVYAAGVACANATAGNCTTPVAANYTASARHARVAASRGFALGQSALAWLLLNGHEVAKNTTEAADLLRAAAGQGEMTAQTHLGLMLAAGPTSGGPAAAPDLRAFPDEGLALLRIAAWQGDAHAQQHVGQACVKHGAAGQTKRACVHLISLACLHVRCPPTSGLRADKPTKWHRPTPHGPNFQC